MTRWFYTDPLAAAWMAKHFGMKFNLPNGCECYFDEDVAEVLRPSFAGGFKVYVHPDSLAVLEPREGDFVTFDDLTARFSHQRGWGILCNIRPETHEYRYVYDDGKAVYATSSPPKRILQRAGKPFHHPDRED
jgi:hypothetical protein